MYYLCLTNDNNVTMLNKLCTLLCETYDNYVTMLHKLCTLLCETCDNYVTMLLTNADVAGYKREKRTGLFSLLCGCITKFK